MYSKVEEEASVPLVRRKGTQLSDGFEREEGFIYCDGNFLCTTCGKLFPDIVGFSIPYNIIMSNPLECYSVLKLPAHPYTSWMRVKLSDPTTISLHIIFALS